MLHRLLNFLFEAWGWLRIFLSPLLLGIILAVVIYLSVPTSVGLVLGGIIIGISSVIGVLWANKFFKSKKGTIWYLSQTNSWPEVEEK